MGDRSRPYKHVQRAQIILLSAERLPVVEVAQRAGISQPTMWRWQRRYGEDGAEGLLRDKSRPPGRSPLSAIKMPGRPGRRLRACVPVDVGVRDLRPVLVDWLNQSLGSLGLSGLLVVAAAVEDAFPRER